MTTIAASLPLAETFAPASPRELTELVAQAHAAKTPLYPLGGGTGLSCGLAPRQSGWGLATTNLTRVVDYPARDMTITVEAGITMRALADELAQHGQRLPIDAPQSEQATLGGVVASAAGGPRRNLHGTIRDYVIGITAVDGRGVSFKAGGRVVKNVAGYDFCKLLTGSLGSLAVISQVTLKLRPCAEATALVACDVANLAAAEPVLASLVNFPAPPAAIELLAGPAWDADPALGPRPGAVAARLLVGLEGTAPEVAWLIEQLSQAWRAAGLANVRTISGPAADELWSRLVEFPAADKAALVVKARVLPSAVTSFVAVALALDANCSVQAHAGCGVINLSFPEFSAAEAGRVLIRGLQPAAIKAAGHATIDHCPPGVELTHQAVWGPLGDEAALMRAVKAQLDPHGLFNPGLTIFAC